MGMSNTILRTQAWQLIFRPDQALASKALLVRQEMTRSLVQLRKAHRAWIAVPVLCLLETMSNRAVPMLMQKHLLTDLDRIRASGGEGGTDVDLTDPHFLTSGATVTFAGAKAGTITDGTSTATVLTINPERCVRARKCHWRP